MSDSFISSMSTSQRPQPNVPATLQEREGLRQAIANYVRTQGLCAPLTVNELKHHATALLRQLQQSEQVADFAAVLINNILWRDTVASIPFNKRLLLMPMCLRDADRCPAQCDEIGLLCEHCGSCIIDDFKRSAEELGYAVLIAEGSPMVMALIETGQIEAVVGVSCLATLERVFPYMEAGAVPGIAIPLLYDGCHNTAIDTDWLWEAIYDFSSHRSAVRLDLEQQRQRVDAWFTRESLQDLLQTENTATESLALDWLTRAGKRWRPFLTVCTQAALDPDSSVPERDIQRTAVAVECFHKASLIHDDIEDNDHQRYGVRTLHADQGVPMALNVGDLLIGWGYQLLAELDVPNDLRVRLIQCATRAHRILCLGQGEELTWSQRPTALSCERVLEIFRQKTAPAFEVALTMGALLAHADDEILKGLHQYSEALGVAYQIRDDLDDYLVPGENQRRLLDRPSIVMALATQYAQEEDRELLLRCWQEPNLREEQFTRIMQLFKTLTIERQTQVLMDRTKTQVIEALMQLHTPALKGLLRRVISKIFGDFDIMGCCNDPATPHDPNHSQGPRSA